MHRSLPLAALATAAACALVAATPGAAAAHGGGKPPVVTVLNSEVLAPYQVAAARDGLYASDSFNHRVVRLGGGALETLATEPQGVAGVAVNDRGDLAWTSSVGGPDGWVSNEVVIRKKGGATTRVDLHGYERTHNPDAAQRYGIDDPTPCQQEAFAEEEGGASYTGIADSHPYAIAPHGDGWIIADAGANALLRINARGAVSTIAVLPRQPLRITAEAAAALGVPECVVGAVYNYEAVPTDVEVVGHQLVVSMLPGGPEDPSLGSRGSVWTVDLRSGKASRVAGGFLGATNLAVGTGGRIFVAEFFAGRISVIERGRVRTYVELPNVLSVDWSKGTLYAGTMAESDDEGWTAPGTLVAIR